MAQDANQDDVGLMTSEAGLDYLFPSVSDQEQTSKNGEVLCHCLWYQHLAMRMTKGRQETFCTQDPRTPNCQTHWADGTKAHVVLELSKLLGIPIQVRLSLTSPYPG